MALIVYIEDVFEDLVSKVSTALNKPIYYMHGSLKEINFRLEQMSKSKDHFDKKFPLVALLHDYPRSRGGVYEEVTLTVLISTDTIANYISDERLSNNFKPILDPIYLELMNQLNLSSFFNTRSALLIPHQKIDHYFYGTENGNNGHAQNRFNDLVDCIEIRNLELSIYAKNC